MPSRIISEDTAYPDQPEQPEKPQPLAGRLNLLVKWQDERVKDANGFLARRTLGWFYHRDMILYGNAFFMEYGCAVKYFHPSEVLLTT